MNLDEIARLANVSRTTASRVVNQHPRVSEATRLRVQQVIQRHGYIPNAAARALASSRTGVIGVVVPAEVTAFHRNPWFAEVVQGCADEANENDLGLMLILERIDSELTAKKLVSNFVTSQRVDGLVIVNSRLDDKLTPILRDASFPHMMVGQAGCENGNFVDIRNRDAARKLTAHILGHGWRKPILINGPKSMMVSRDREQGFLDAVEELGLDPMTIPILHAEFSKPQIFDAAIRLLTGPDAVDAFVTASDVIANEVFRAASHLGLVSGQDFGIVAFDDLLFQTNQTWGLTTMIQPIQQMGRRALQLVGPQILGQTQQPIREWFEGSLIARTSCGCKPNEQIETPAARH